MAFSLRTGYLALYNGAVSLAWVVAAFAASRALALSSGFSPSLDAALAPSASRLAVFSSQISFAIGFAALEVVHALLGVTNARVANTAMFVIARAFIAFYVAYLHPNPGSLPHAALALVWSAGEAVRFGCFSAEAVAPGAVGTIRGVRYTVGPPAFSIGTLLEYVLIIRALAAAPSGKESVYLWVAAVTWPLGFGYLLRILLRNARAHRRQPGQPLTRSE